MTASLAELVRRVEVLEALAAITVLSADYCYGADHRNLDLFLSVWADDGVWQVSRDQAFVGLGDIAEAITRQWDGTARAFHWTSNPNISVDEDGLGAQGRFDSHAHIQTMDGNWLEIAGTYADRYVKTHCGWRIVRRVVEVHSQRPAQQ